MAKCLFRDARNWRIRGNGRWSIEQWLNGVLHVSLFRTLDDADVQYMTGHAQPRDYLRDLATGETRCPPCLDDCVGFHWT